MLRSRPNVTLRGTLLSIAVLLASPGIAGSMALAEDGKPAVGLIMEKLPPHKSAAYKTLRKLAGKATGQALEMTKSEVWNVPPAHVDRLIEEAARQGVIVTKLDETWNRALAPMAEGKAMTDEQKRMMSEAMESKAAMGMSMMELPKGSALEYALTKDMLHTPKGEAPPTIVIPLNEKTLITVERKSITKQGDSYIWHGAVQGSGEPVTLVCWPGGRMSGNISYRGHMYTIKSMGSGMHGVVEMSPDGLPPEHAPVPPDKMRQMNMTEDPLVKQGDAKMMEDAVRSEKADGGGQLLPDRADTKNLEDAPIAAGKSALIKKPSLTGRKQTKQTARRKSKGAKGKPVEIALMVAYTRAAAARYSDIEKDLIALTIAETNESFRASGAGGVKIRLVHAYETDYAEKGGHFEHLYGMVQKNDGIMEEVHALRDKHKADAVVLIVHDPLGCGLAARVAAEADRAFAVVHQECAATSYSLAHEIGHLIGARHDLALDDTMEPFPHGHGFVNGAEWRTMMSYKESCNGCPRLPIWSNPAIKVKGVRAGDTKANNAKVIRDRAVTVSRFR